MSNFLRKFWYAIKPIYPEKDGFMAKIGPWACRYSWAKSGRFANGSRWSSGWHNWKKEADYDY